jgi:putative copper export protein
MHVVPEWLDLLSLASCMGVVVCRLRVLTPSMEKDHSYQGNFFSHIWTFFYFGVAVLACGSIVELLIGTFEISGRPFPALFSVVPTVLLKTHYGHVWIIRMCAIGLLALSTGILRRRDTQPVLFIMLLLLLLVSVTASASGHASDAGDLSVPEIIDWLHLLAACLWGGGLMVLTVSILPNLMRDGDRTAPLMAHSASRFSQIAGIAVGVTALSALYNLWYYVRFLDALWKTPYGRTVIAKIVLFGFLLGLGAFNRYISIPLLKERAGIPVDKTDILGRLAGAFFAPFKRSLGGGKIAPMFKRLVRTETLLIIAVLFCAALLRHEVPARHMSQMGHVREGGAYHKMDNGHDSHPGEQRELPSVPASK